MDQTQGRKQDNPSATQHRSLLLRYVLLTTALFVPLLFSFVTLRNLYPFAASTMMLGNAATQNGRDYYILRGETMSGEMIDLPAIKLTNALSGRNWSLVEAAVHNRSFNLPSLHPANAQLTTGYGADQLPRAVRLDDLLRAWGNIYNSRLPANSVQKLKSVRVDAYRWEGGINGEYARFVETWTAEL